MDIATLTQIVQAGGTAILLVILYFLWQEFREQNKFIRDMLTQAQAERKVLAEQMGMTTQELSAQAAIVRRKMEAEKNLHANQPN